MQLYNVLADSANVFD